MNRVVYRELLSEDDIGQCFELQKKIFGINNADALPVMFIGLLGRRNPKIGFAVGAFIEDILAGFILAIPNLELNSIYAMAMGVNPDYRGKNIGLNLFLKLREFANQLNISSCYFIYEPLESNLGYLYYNKLNIKGTKYECAQANSKGSLPNDKILVYWDLTKSKKVKNNKFQYQHNKIATNQFKPNSSQILIEIPAEFNSLKNRHLDKALQWRLQTRNLFLHYINDNKYLITGFHNEKSENETRYFYILEQEL